MFTEFPSVHASADTEHSQQLPAALRDNTNNICLHLEQFSSSTSRSGEF